MEGISGEHILKEADPLIGVEILAPLGALVKLESAIPD